ncbi:ATP-dependent RNA helicase HrpA [Wohlfahrtiimonas chitiniclastica]|uniref:ATP-dependent RNA helicase HrpA n=1 Tax=Wohlfahrtiimonas chitiniclastica TaxID=400946 RepID=UPI0007B4026A|nr:ATP-dependent RNA helicase HrpA [Wohlfahrtiimonas chitiniclastica]KZS23044.1 ATP-dependent helicase [Wohlfahrtiimonas chitiniclastica]WHR55476.1 ATP-dependent RNA helicase HrpA [Wohlfahrtiimonas chitiniclastica]
MSQISLSSLFELLPHTECKRAHTFRRALHTLKKSRGDEPQALEALATDMMTSAECVLAKKAAFPELNYNESLPIYAARDEIKAALEAHPVIVVCGETGSGKTTQLAKFCLELGLGARGLIGHTQPRRLAARSVADRIAEELHVPIGGFVGYKMRFADQTAPETTVKLMTDGILLAELTKDPYLNQYEVIIIDEAHERSLNIDFLLGILKRILEKRRDLKVIITSATIDPEKFATFFKTPHHSVPIINVSGRTYPVELRYRPLIQENEGDDLSLIEGITAAVHELSTEQPGDILVFLPGEREIRDAADVLSKEFSRHYDVLPLFSRLSNAEQNRIFKPHHKLRIVLATNVAETSLTVPGIKYVIDSGIARISRYSPRSRLQRLLIEPIARASANQRSGRCGRVSEGIAIRLFSREDFEARPLFLDPEIKRTQLASVILQMAHLRLGNPEDFTFIEPPEARQIKEGYMALREIKAIDDQSRLTRLGRQLALLPLDPRFGAMIFKGAELGVAHEMLILVALLSIQNPNERPIDKQQAADEKHRLFKDKQSDFMGYLNLWFWYQNTVKGNSQSYLRELCRQHFISFMRMREWFELYQQIREMLKSSDVRLNDLPTLAETQTGDYDFPAFNSDLIHQSLLVGLLDHIGALGEEGAYQGAMGQKFRIFPGSSLYKKPPKWLMAMEIVETSQVYARMCAGIKPEWLEIIGSHLIKSQYNEPHWSKKQGQAVAEETVFLFNLAIIRNRRVSFGAINPELSRELMIKEGLIQDDIATRAAFYRKNRATIEKVETMEDKTRRRDILAEEVVLYEWYDARLPKDCYSVKKLEKWCQVKANNDALIFSERDILAHDEDLNLEEFPEVLELNGLKLNAQYLFDPAAEDDGMTLLVPLAALNLLDQTRLDWLSHGLILEKITELLRTLPKSYRRQFVPLPDFAAEIFNAIEFAEGNLYFQLQTIIQRLRGIEIEPHEFDEKALPKHLRMNIRIIDAGGKTLGQGRELDALQKKFSHKAESAFQQLVATESPSKKRKKAVLAEKVVHSEPQTRPFTDDNWVIEPEVKFTRNGIQLVGYVALEASEDGLKAKLYDRQSEASRAHLHTLIELSLKALRQEVKYLQKQWPQFGKLALMFRQVGNETILKEDLMKAVIRDYLDEATLPRDAKTFNQLIDTMRKGIVSQATDLTKLVIEIFMESEKVSDALRALHPMNRALIEKPIQKAKDRLIYAGFISETPAFWRAQLPRYLKAMAVRVERFSQNISRDEAHAKIIANHLSQLAKAVEKFGNSPEVVEYRWMIEELAVSLFAQPMKTAVPVSEKRLNKVWEALDLMMKNQR